MGLFRDFKKATQAKTPDYSLAAARQGQADMAQQQMENEIKSKTIGGAIDLYGKTTDMMEVSPITDYLRSMTGAGEGALLGAETGVGAEALGMGAEALAAGGAGGAGLEALLAGAGTEAGLGLGAQALAAGGGASLAGATAGAGTGALASMGPAGWGAMALMALLSQR